MHANLCIHASQLSHLCRFAFALVLLFISTSALAQHGPSHSRKTEAELHIRVNVVPVVIRPPDKRHTENATINYNLIDQKQGMDIDIREEIHPLVGVTRSSGATKAVLKTVTIVLQ